MTLQEGYDKKYPSDKNITVSLSMYIYDILDIQEIHMQYKVFLRVELLWYDPRITFRNLKPKKDDNQLNANEIDQIWSPQLKFLNSLLPYFSHHVSFLRHDDNNDLETRALTVNFSDWSI